MTDLEQTGIIFDIDTFAVHDGPGIRMAVYLKGCPLSCAWCHSPESQSPRAELAYYPQRCVFCAACVSVCPEGVHRVTGNTHDLDRSRCTSCGKCVEVCPQQALTMKGWTVSVEAVVRRAERLRPFFSSTGGGVTLSGGEVTMQPEFTAACLRELKSRQIHTIVETAGLCSADTLRPISDTADLVYFDIKLIDSDQHRKWTGAPNTVILDNLRSLDRDKTVVRVPLIPEITDTDENLRGIAKMVAELGFPRIELLPYNESAGAKYEWLGRRMDIPAESQGSDRPNVLRNLVRTVAPDLSVTVIA